MKSDNNKNLAIALGAILLAAFFYAMVKIFCQCECVGYGIRGCRR